MSPVDMSATVLAVSSVAVESSEVSDLDTLPKFLCAFILVRDFYLL